MIFVPLGDQSGPTAWPLAENVSCVSPEPSGLTVKTCGSALWSVENAILPFAPGNVARAGEADPSNAAHAASAATSTRTPTRPRSVIGHFPSRAQYGEHRSPFSTGRDGCETHKCSVT